MDITNAIKRAPRWTWYVAAGTGVGVGAIKLWKGRAVPAATQVPGDTSGAPTPVGVASPGGNPPGVIVPPVVLPPSDPTSGGFDPATLLTLFQQSQPPWEEILALLAPAGSAPAPVTSNPTPVGWPPPAQPAPVVPPPPKAPPAPVACPSSYPHLSSGTPSPSTCYDIRNLRCVSHKWYHDHVYQNGHTVTVARGDTC